MIALLRTAALLLTLCAFAPARAGEVRDVAPERIARHTWVIHGPLGDPSVENQGFMNNPAFVVTKQGVVVIDPGSSVQAGRMVLRQIRKVTKKPVTHVVNTHVHGDHWLGNQALHEAFPKASILAHPEMIAKAQLSEGKRWLEVMERLTEGFTAGTRAVIPAIPIADGQFFKSGGVTFRILAAANAHSKTDIMIEAVEEGVLFLGDNVMNGRFGRMDDGSFRGNIAACELALSRPTKAFVPGHGKSGGREVVAAYRDYLAILFDTVKREYDAGRQDYEMKETVKARLAPYAAWEGFDLHFGRHISVAVLEIESM